MIPLILAPLIAKLAENGLNLIGNAVLNKGKQVVEDKLGVSLDSALSTDEGKQALLQLQNDHEEELLRLAIEDRKLDLDFYKLDAEDRDSARDREVALAATDSSWLAKNIVPILALIVVLGGGSAIVYSPDTDVRIAAAAVVSSVLTYYFGTSKGADRQNTAIQNLAQGVSK